MCYFFPVKLLHILENTHTTLQYPSLNPPRFTTPTLPSPSIIHPPRFTTPSPPSNIHHYTLSDSQHPHHPLITIITPSQIHNTLTTLQHPSLHPPRLQHPHHPPPTIITPTLPSPSSNTRNSPTPTLTRTSGRTCVLDWRPSSQSS